jgi:predicted O-methyltransferase YrrM
VEFVLDDAGRVLGQYPDLEFVLIDCEKDDYTRLLGMLRLAPGAVVVADSIVSHDLREYVEAVRAYPGVEPITLPIGKGLEVSRFARGSQGRG